MDSWTNDQVESMRRNGNVTSNRVYNPRNSKPAIPLDVDEVDTALERFIRQKYDQQSFSASSVVRPAIRQDTGSTRSSEDQPPPLPPKPGKRFGFGLRSVSSALPMTKHSHISPPTSPDTANAYPPSPPFRVNKQSRVFGTNVGGGGDNIESKMTTLRDMGFADEKRNAAILRGLNGNLERAIETIVRLGDSNTPNSRPRSPVKPLQAPGSQPTSMSQPFSRVGIEPPDATPNGLTVISAVSQNAKREAVPLPSMPSGNSGNENQIPHTRFYNPFESSNPRSETWPLEKSLESMQVSQPPPQQQPLFPNATGGYPIQPRHSEASRLQQSMTPPVPQLHHHVHTNPYAQQMTNPTNIYNPFLQSSQPAYLIASDFYDFSNQPLPTNSGPYNPFQIPQPATRGYTDDNLLHPPQDLSTQQTAQHQQYYMLNESHPPPLTEQPQMNPFVQQQPPTAQSQPQYHQSPPPGQYPMQPLQTQPTGRFDKSSIMALYNYPQLAPPPLPNGNVTSENQALPTESSGLKPSTSNPRTPGQRSVTMPAQLASGSRNPFHTASHNTAAVTSNAIPAVPSSLSRHVSQESVDVGGYQSGRHSPDAFASLSARFVR
ncbi:MAG: hypothetical protein Q9209_001825 [Squamulea sp. 1 TL-2023]